MKRAPAVVVMLLFLLPAPYGGLAAGIEERWSADRLLADNLTLPAHTGLVIDSGVNVSLSPGPFAGPAALVLEIDGKLEVCGTAAAPVIFSGPDRQAQPSEGASAHLTIQGNGLPDQLSVRNCTFRNLIVELDGTAGELRDCLFDNGSVFVADATARLFNCTFRNSTISVYNPSTTNQTLLSACRFEPSGGPSSSASAAILVSGYVDISACEISGYKTGLLSSSGLPLVRDCRVEGCEIGINLDTTDPTDTPIIENCTVRDCSQAGVLVSGSLLLRNSTVENSTEGLVLYYLDAGPFPFNWSLEGNRIYNNSDFGMVLYGQDLHDLGTLFDDGAGHTNLRGRVFKKDGVPIQVLSPAGRAVFYCNLTLTDATGNTTRDDFIYGGSSVETLSDYQIDNSGRRLDFYPYTVTAESLGVSNSTVLSGPGEAVTLVLALLPDLVPAGLALSPPSPRAGDYVSFYFLVNNSGGSPSGLTSAIFYLDGKRLDESQLFSLIPHSSSVVRSVEWRAVQGAHRIIIALDPANKVQENDEGNNDLTLDFTVRPAPANAPAPLDLRLPGAGVLLLFAIAAGYWAARQRKARKEGV